MSAEALVPAPRTEAIIRPVAPAAEVIDAHRLVVELIEQALVAGEDYGVIPGTDKPTLLKPGAERIAIAFGARVDTEIVEKEIDHDRPVTWSKRKWRWGERRGEKIWETETGTSLGLYRYVIRCRLVRPDGRIIGEGLGSCSSMEAKYVEAPRNAENTVLKMAKKRAHVEAVLTMAGLSNRFTQDIEEMELGGQPAKSPAPPQSSASAPPAAGSGAPPPARSDDPSPGGAGQAIPAGPPMGTRKQAAMIWARIEEIGWTREQGERWLVSRLNNHHVSQVDRRKVSAVIEELMKMQKGDEP